MRSECYSTMLGYDLVWFILYLSWLGEGFSYLDEEPFCALCVPDAACNNCLLIQNWSVLQISCDGNGTRAEFPNVFNNSRRCLEMLGKNELRFVIRNYCFDTIIGHAINVSLPNADYGIAVVIENNNNLKSLNAEAFIVRCRTK